MKQTAVEWLVDEMKCIGIIVPKESSEKLLELMFKAKEMEREQIVNAYKEGHYHLDFDSFNPEQYYNETFKTE
jgi:hypothetical protein